MTSLYRPEALAHRYKTRWGTVRGRRRTSPAMLITIAVLTIAADAAVSWLALTLRH